MSERSTQTQWPAWQNRDAYEYTIKLTRRGWAWEFLRRNPRFQCDLARALEHVKYVDQGSNLRAIEPPVDLTRWGLLFRRLLKE